nr:DUF87 domain-containing protein [Vibrio cyclitrophicus]
MEVGRCKETDKPNLWKPTDTNEYLNPNLAILRTMGTGKTQTVKLMLKQLKGQEGLNTDGESLGMLIFDYKDDYVDDEFVNATIATVFEPSNIPINPLSLFGNNRLALINTVNKGGCHQVLVQIQSFSNFAVNLRPMRAVSSHCLIGFQVASSVCHAYNYICERTENVD